MDAPFAITAATPPTARITEPASSDTNIVAVIVISDLEFGGAQRQVVELVNKLDAQNITVYVCSLSDYVPLSTSLERRERLRVIRRKVRFDFTVVFRLALFLRKVKADVVHAFLFDAEIASRLAGRLARTPAIICSERNTNYKAKPRDVLALRLTRSLQDLVIANSHCGAEFNSTLIGYPKHRYRVVRNGVDVQRFRPRPAEQVRESFGIPRDALVIGMFASFKPQKNHGLLLEAIKDITARTERVRFLFVGDALHKGMSDSDAYKAWLVKRIDALAIREHCVFAGNRQDVELIYPICDLTVLPSLFEGTPNALLESMACGVPVVTTDVSDNREIVPDGEVGFVVPSGDVQQLTARILELLEDPTLRARLSHQARAWVLRHFSSERLAENTANVYREAVAVRSPGANARQSR
jgi:glycosyltransferase involved in cell wall biosynthesis